MAKPSYLNAKGIFTGDWNKLTGTGSKSDPLMYDGQKISGTVRWNDGPANYVNGVLVTQTKGTTEVAAEPAPETRPNQPTPQGPTGPSGVTGSTSTTATADMGTKYGIIEALLNDKKYGKPNEFGVGGIWEVFYTESVEKNSGKAADLWKNTDWFKLNDDAKKAYKLKLENEPLYKEQRNQWLIRIKKALAQKNIKVDDATLFDYYDRGVEDDVLTDELISKQTGAAGFGSNDRRTLARIAADNGLDLEKDFAGQVDDWLKRIARGESITNFENEIRAKAAEGKSKYVKDQLGLGFNLSQIYGTYIKEMADAFNVPLDSIDINDPLLQKAIGEGGQMKLNDFKVLISQDSRYKGTPQAASEADLRTQVTDAAVRVGAKVTEADIDSIVKKLLATGMGSFGQSTIDAELRKFISYGAGGAVTGAAGNNLEILRTTAADNGLDLDKTFGSSIQDWLRKIDQGESIDTYKRLIRDAAKMGLPDNVKKMMDQGMDLKTIYNPYRELMSRVLEVNYDTIDLNDPTLRSAIGPDKEMTLYDYQRALRKDPRWQYTDNARREVSDYTLQVLRDFGFQG